MKTFRANSGNYRRTIIHDITKLLIVLFAVMFFLVYNTPAFASRMTCSPPSDAGIVECITSDGRIVTIG